VLSNIEQEVYDLKDAPAHIKHESLVTELGQVFEQLQRWQTLWRTLPPHDALSHIYAQGDVMARFVAAAPATLRDAVQSNLQALLSASLQVDGARFLTPYGFVRALKAGGIQAPQRQLTQAVQLLTVHGAKGLEAPCVLLLDTDAKPSNPPTMGVLIDWPGAQAAPEKFVFIPSEKTVCPSAKSLVAHEQAARAREELNSLYVAMTRAKTKLVLSSVVPHQASSGTWWQRLVVPDWSMPADEAVPSVATAAPVVPVLPSLERLPERGPIKPELDEEAAVSSRMGQAMHRVLEWAVLGAREIPDALRRQAGLEFKLTPQQMQEVTQRAHAILMGEGAWAWDVAQVVWHANEVLVVIEGQMHRIDRLVQLTNQDWWVIDYKSATDPQSHQDLTRQLRRYRQAVADLHPGASVKAAFFNALGQVQELAA
jgi:ATP-dependent helicase/nuclease subunit A